LSRCGQTTESLAKLHCPMEPSLSQRRLQGAETQTGFRSPLFFDRFPETAIEEVFASRSTGRRLFQRSMDFEAGWQADRARVRGALLPAGRVAPVGRRIRLERPKARATRHAKGRSHHCPLETDRLAPDKKKPKNWARTWPFWTKADFCSSPTCVEHGHRWDKHRNCITVTGGTGFRPFRPLRSRQFGNEWGCMCNCMRAILPGRRLWTSSANSG